jgi:hypothetical protein
MPQWKRIVEIRWGVMSFVSSSHTFFLSFVHFVHLSHSLLSDTSLFNMEQKHDRRASTMYNSRHPYWLLDISLYDVFSLPRPGVGNLSMLEGRINLAVIK